MSGIDLSGFDTLDERYRWCVYCEADCWPEPENQRHDPTCPITTGVFPVDEDPFLPGSFGRCAACDWPFDRDDKYMVANDDTGRCDTAVPPVGWVVCIGCGVAARDPRLRGDLPEGEPA